MDKTYEKVKQISKKAIIMIVLITIILSNLSVPSFAFSVNNGPGEKGGNGSMPADWVSYVLSQAGTPYSQGPERMTTHYDCSSFVDRMTAKYLGQEPNGMWTGSTATDERFQEISPDQLQPWDILWKSTHMEFYAGGGYTFGAHSYSKPVDYGYGQDWTKVYRIKGSPNFQGDSNSFNKKNPIDEIVFGEVSNKSNFYYEGVPKSEIKATGGNWGLILHKFMEFLGRILNLILLGIRLPFIGLVTLVEIFTTNIFESVLGTNAHENKDDGFTASVNSDRAITIDNIIFGRIEALNADFFVSPANAIKNLQGRTGTGYKIEDLEDKKDKQNNESKTEEEKEKDNYDFDDQKYKESPIGIIRASYAAAYYMTMLFAIALLFIIGLGVLIKAILSTLPGEKASYKEILYVWVKGIAFTMLTVIYTALILKLNAFFVSVLANSYKDGTGIGNIYTMVRTRAYDIRPIVGLTALIMYGVLIWFSIRFAFIYVKRLVQILVIALAGVILPAYSVLQEVFKGKADLRINWVKELTYLVFIQTIHALLYLIFMSIAFSVGDTLTGLILAIIIMNYMLKFSGKLREIFNISTPGRSILGNTLDYSDPAELAAGVTGGILYKQFKKGRKAGGILENNTLVKMGLFGSDAAVTLGYNSARRVGEFLKEYRSLSEKGNEMSGNAKGELAGAENMEGLSPEEMTAMQDQLSDNLQQGGVVQYVDDLGLSPIDILKLKQEGLLAEDNSGRLFLNTTAKGMKEKLQGNWEHFKEGQKVPEIAPGKKRLSMYTKVYDPKTGKMKRVRNNITRDTIANFTHSFIASKNDLEEFKRALKSSGMLAASMIGGLVYIPIIMTNGFVGARAVFFVQQTKNLQDIMKSMAKNRKENGYFNNLNKILLAVDVKLAHLKMDQKGLGGKVIPSKKIGGVVVPEKQTTYKQNGIIYSQMQSKVTMASDEILNAAESKTVKDMGKIKLDMNYEFLEKKKGFRNKSKIMTFRSVFGNGKLYNRARTMNATHRELVKIDARLEQEKVRELFIKEGYVDSMQKYGQSVTDFAKLQNMSIEGVKNTIKENFNRNYTTTDMIEYNKVYNAEVIHGEQAFNLDDVVNRDFVARKMQEMIRATTINRLKKMSLGDLSDEVVTNEVEKVIRENNLNLTVYDTEDVKASTAEMVRHTVAMEANARNARVSDIIIEPNDPKEKYINNTKDQVSYNKIDASIDRNQKLVYKAANVEESEYKRLENLRKTDIENLTLGEAFDLKEDRLLSYIEADKYAENLVNLIDMSEIAQTPEQIEFANRYYNGESLEGIKAMQGTSATHGDIGTAYENEIEYAKVLNKEMIDSNAKKTEKELIQSFETEAEKVDYIVRRMIDSEFIEQKDVDKYYNIETDEEALNTLEEIVRQNKQRLNYSERGPKSRKDPLAIDDDNMTDDDMADILVLLEAEASRQRKEKAKAKDKAYKKSIGKDDDDDE